MDIDFTQANQQAALASMVQKQGQPQRDLVKDSDTQSESDKKASEVRSNAQDSSKVIGLKADKVSIDEIESAVNDVNDFVQSQSRHLNFSFDEASKRSVVKVTDVETGDVIRQLPSDEVLKLAARIQDLQSDVGAAVGVLFNKAV